MIFAMASVATIPAPAVIAVSSLLSHRPTLVAVAVLLFLLCAVWLVGYLVVMWRLFSAVASAERRLAFVAVDFVARASSPRQLK